MNICADTGLFLFKHAEYTDFATVTRKLDGSTVKLNKAGYEPFTDRDSHLCIVCDDWPIGGNLVDDMSRINHALSYFFLETCFGYEFDDSQYIIERNLAHTKG